MIFLFFILPQLVLKPRGKPSHAQDELGNMLSRAGWIESPGYSILAGCGLETNGQSADSEETGGAGGVAPFSETA